jgi:hypothetical protein
MKPYNWKTDADWTDREDAPVGGWDETITDETELMLPKDAKGLESLKEALSAYEEMKMAGMGGALRDLEGNNLGAFNDAWIAFSEAGYPGGRGNFHTWVINEFFGEPTADADYAKGGRVGLLRGGDPEAPEMVEDELSTMELMQDQGIPYGPQASRINKDVLIEEVVKEFIRRKGRKPRSNDEIIEFYMEEMAGGSGPQRVAYNPGDYDPEIVEQYEQYKFNAIEQGQPVMSIDEFMQMERAGVRSGGLPSILGV